VGAGEGRASGSSPGVKPGALTALLKEIAVAPEEAQGSAWEGVLHAGAVVGRFELVRELGHGGFGVVWEALDLELGRSVAFKAVRAGGKTTVREERLFKEAEAAARLQHPNIVTLHDVGRAEQGPYLILELLEGRTLAERRAQGTLPLRETLRIGVKVAKGVAHAHAHGVVHRDLTPGNVFLCDDGQVKVLDFGMAQAFGQRKVDGGTRAYMAPEQARGAPEDERTDVFVLGVILHQMLSGELPFPDAEALASSSPAPGLEVPEAPALGELVGRMLEKDPVKRPRDGGEVLSALTTFQRELERLPSTGSAPARTRRPASGLKDLFAELKRRRVIRALAGYAIVSFGVLQVVEPLMHGLGLPDWTLKTFVVALATGFPAAAALAWTFDLTRAGIRRTAPAAAGGESPPHSRGATLAVLLAGLGLVAAAPGIFYFFVWPGGVRGAATGAGAPSAGPEGRSIAVLPFVNMSSDREQDYFADGMAEEILNALAQVEGLQVAGRTSSFSFKGKSAKIEEIGRELHVAAVLEGSVRKAGTQVRVTAQIIKVADGFHLWAQTFDRSLSDVFAVQNEIAQAVVEALKVKMLAGQGSAVKAQRPTRPDAYTEYLLGKQLLRQGSIESIRQARRPLERAIALDPAYAPARAALAAVLGRIGGYLAETPAEVAEYARLELAAAERAIALDPDLGDGYAARGRHRMSFDWDWPGALADLERAVALSPGDGDVRLEYAGALAAAGRLPQAIAAVRRVTEIDPLAPMAWSRLAHLLHRTGDYAAARAAGERALEIAPDSVSARAIIGFALLAEGKPAEALEQFQRSPAAFFRLTGLAIAYHRLGNSRESQAALDELRAKLAGSAAYQIAEVYAARGETDQAFEWLERARVQRDAGMQFVRDNNLFTGLRSDPRFDALLRKMNLQVR
jgi:TolB-like protein